MPSSWELNVQVWSRPDPTRTPSLLFLKIPPLPAAVSMSSPPNLTRPLELLIYHPTHQVLLFPFTPPHLIVLTHEPKQDKTPTLPSLLLPTELLPSTPSSPPTAANPPVLALSFSPAPVVSRTSETCLPHLPCSRRCSIAGTPNLSLNA